MKNSNVLSLLEAIICLKPYIGHTYYKTLVRLLRMAIMYCNDELPVSVKNLSMVRFNYILDNFSYLEKCYQDCINEQTK